MMGSMYVGYTVLIHSIDSVGYTVLIPRGYTVLIPIGYTVLIYVSSKR